MSVCLDELRRELEHLELHRDRCPCPAVMQRLKEVREDVQRSEANDEKENETDEA